MSPNLIDYVKVFKGAISKNTCKDALQELDSSLHWNTHVFYRHDGKFIDHGTEPLVYNGQAIQEYQQLIDNSWQAIKDYIDFFDFHWYTSWQGFDKLKFMQYNVNTEMKEHCDHIHSIFDGSRKGIPILTIIGLLNDDFEGGNLVLFEDNTIELQAGDIVVFPSVFLFPHAVTPITSGNRFSFATWVF